MQNSECKSKSVRGRSLRALQNGPQERLFFSLFLTFITPICSYHVTYEFHSESKLDGCLNVKELLARLVVGSSPVAVAYYAALKIVTYAMFYTDMHHW